jgi:LDH2 family malate/lactate/ureidoglycolate dehydrogenase
MGSTRYDYSVLLNFAAGLGAKAGLPADRAHTQAEVLLEGDLMGHTTHGLALLPGILSGLESGAIRASGDPVKISDRGSAILWDADRLPGTWMLTQAISDARRRIPQYPVVTVVLNHMTHIAALGAYLRQATDHGLVISIMNSDPSMRTVVPAGGAEPQLAANPLAFGYPTDGDPVLIDISTSSVANGWVRRWNAEKKKLPGKWLLDASGDVTDEPAALFGPPPGSMLPLGGLELGHKGFALGLIVEVLTAGLAGFGRANGATGTSGTPVFLQLIDPAGFAGESALRREAGWLAKACRASKPLRGRAKVRMPGDSALATRREQMELGVALYPSIMPELKKWADKLKVPAP